MKKTLLALLLCTTFAAGTTKTLCFPIGPQVLWGEHSRTEFVVIATAYDSVGGHGDEDTGLLLCASEWRPKEQRYDLDQIQCHAAVPQPVPQELRLR
jgi:hypothetical protein